MAIAGSPGIPSCGFAIRYGRIVSVGMTQNKPPSCVELDLPRAAARILAGETVQIDMRGDTYPRLVALIEDHTWRFPR